MSRRKQKNPGSTYIVLGIIAVVAIVVAVVLILASSQQGSDAQTASGPNPSIPRGLTEAGLPYLGQADAPVTMRIYEDMGCHNCRDFFNDTEPSVLENFVATGKVKIEIYTLAFVNSQSLPGAEAAACALDQEKFWEYREVLFENQGVQPFDRSHLVQWASDLGLDRSAFASCFDRAIHQREIVDRSQQAFNVGITATPTTEVNGVRHVGVIPYIREGEPGFQQILEEAFQAAETGG